MRFYHGTIKTFADNIMREGLVPEKHKFHIKPSPPDKHGVYLSNNLSDAKKFAIYRMTYESVELGQSIGDDESYLREVHKTESQVIRSTPIVLVINLPDNWKLVPDALMNDAFVSYDIIPPVYIEKVIPVKGRKVV